ncbi:MAG: hypothetical protein OEZ43_03845 [Gammaproteobacteria bacterium]|nr:hypothetical protein [Gammaproteobacteria bacterium]
MATRTAPLLFLLTLCFGFRVAAQFASLHISLPTLPPFEAWHSGTMPYFLLLTFQILILFAMLRYSFRARYNRISVNPFWGKWLWRLGLLYVLVMILRLIFGQTLFEESRWFSNTLSTIFHFVLAAYVLLIANILKQKKNTKG